MEKRVSWIRNAHTNRLDRQARGKYFFGDHMRGLVAFYAGHERAPARVGDGFGSMLSGLQDSVAEVPHPSSTSEAPQSWQRECAFQEGRARRGMERLVSGCDILCELELPLGGMDALETIRHGVQQLEARVNEATQWARSCPDGGRLLHQEMCLAAGDEEPPEWSCGQLYVSEMGFLFESHDSPPWQIGFRKWEDVAFLHGRPSSTSDTTNVSMQPKGQSPMHRFAGVHCADLLQKIGGLTDAPPEPPLPEVTECSPTPELQDETEEEERQEHEEEPEEEVCPDIPQPLPEPVQPLPNVEDVNTVPVSPEVLDNWIEQWTGVDETKQIRKINQSITVESFAYTESFLAAAESLPAAEVPSKVKAEKFTAHLPHASLDAIKVALQGAGDDWPVKVYLEKELNIHSIQCTPWAKARRYVGTRVRRLQFRMPLPDEVPRAVQKLVSMPKETAVTLLARLCNSDTTAVLLQEILSHDVAFGEHFSVQDVFVFQAHPDGGVLFEKFTSVRWLQALPWWAGVVSTFIEMKVKADADRTGKRLAEILEYVS